MLFQKNKNFETVLSDNNDDEDYISPDEKSTKIQQVLLRRSQRIKEDL